MNYWWVNQNQTYAQEVGGGYMWSPKANANGAKNQFYDNMTHVEPGDVVFSFCDTQIKAVGVVSGKAETAPKPTEFGATGTYWGPEGWLVPVIYTELNHPIRPKDHIEALRPTLPAKYSPLQPTGSGNQGVYLAAVPIAMATVLRGLIGNQLDVAISANDSGVLDQALDDAAESDLKVRADLSETEKVQLILARRGQGLFRSRLEAIEQGCRMTGVRHRAHLRASHIKPWRHSSNAEKVDGNNGLLLSPHVDHLFDRGYVSFGDDGSVIVSQRLDATVLQAWAIDPTMNVGAFNPSQSAYLDYHRTHVLKQ